MKKYTFTFTHPNEDVIVAKTRGTDISDCLLKVQEMLKPEIWKIMTLKRSKEITTAPRT